MTSSDCINTPTFELLNARRILRTKQEESAAQFGDFRSFPTASTLELALRELTKAKQFKSTGDPQTVKRGVFRFDRNLEEQRIGLAEDLIRRVDPGPLEDPAIFALLAYQAASVEMAIPIVSQDGAGHDEARWSRFLLGTIPSTDVNAFATIGSDGGYTVVEVHAALIDFIYQAAKAVVAAQHPSRSTDGKTAVTARTAAEDIRSALSRNREPANHLYRTLEAYFFRGLTRGVRSERVPLQQQPLISLLVGMAERFVIAHEFGHGHTNSIKSQLPDLKPAWASELLADAYATAITVISASRLDRLPPEFALAGGIFSLACLKLVGQGLSLLRDGVNLEDTGGSSHPPFSLRAAQIVRAFHTFFDVQYDDVARSYELLLVAGRKQPKEPDETVRTHIDRGAYSSANTLFILWESVEEMLRCDHISKRPLHPMWQ
jgi:hypothetical protein